VSSKKRRWLIAAGLMLGLIVISIAVLTSILKKRYEPYIRDQAIAYLRGRFDSEVELATLHIRMPGVSTLRLLLTGGRGSVAEVDGDHLVLRYMGRRDLPPMFAVRAFHFDVDLALLFGKNKRVPLVQLDGMEIYVPPKGERPVLNSSAPRQGQEASKKATASKLVIEEVRITDATLVILPRDQSRIPLSFDIHRLRLESAGKDVSMNYDAELTNPKPPGLIHSQGKFGPWAADGPGDTPLAGNYTFENADLGVFHGIAGTLNSTGQFEGTLDTIRAWGQASVKDFRLKSAGNPVPLTTSFEVQVDGTNGNTLLSPVRATLGSTHFTTSGAVIKREKKARRTISLDVSMPNGDLKDLLRLGVKGQPSMEGRISMTTKIDIPPLTGPVKEKLLLDGRFELSQSRFLKSTIQDQIDSLSRRGQGKPGNPEIDEVVSNMTGAFRLEDQVITFASLFFNVPGAAVQLAGDYDLDADKLDFHGALALRAKVSQTMTGWKRWALKPVDPLFAKNGAGTFLHIRMEGSSQSPRFGLDRRGNNVAEGELHGPAARQ
jgi:hypothetical protein